VIVAANLLIAFVGAAGVFAAVLALGIRPQGQLKGLVEPRPGPLERLRQYLDDAGLGVTPGEFLRVSALLGLGAAVAAYLLTSALTAALLGLFVGGFAYYTYLVDRRDRRRQEYQDALVDVIGLLVEGFRAGNTLPAAFDTVARYGPDVVRRDWAQVLARMGAKMEMKEALAEMARRRRDPILDTVVQTLTTVKEKGGRLSVALEGLQQSVRERVRIRRRVRAEQSQPLWELRLVAALPFLVVPVLRSIAEEYVAFWKTPLGQALLLLAWGLTIAGYLIAQRFITRTTKVEESFGVIEVTAGDSLPAGLSDEDDEEEDEEEDEG
jgi:tight adherence protein B